MMAITKKRINETNNHQNDKQRKLYDGPLLEIERLNSLSASAGQSIHAVSLRSDGTFVEVLLPAKLSKKAKLVGSWDLIEVFLVVLEHQDDGDILFNAHILQEPFHRTKFRGDIILIRHDVEGSPVDFSITSYKKFLELESTEMSFDFYDSILSGENTRTVQMPKLTSTISSRNS
jgi:Family of unknown function (DUF5880)